MGCVIGRINYGLKVVFCFKHFTAFHYHHHTRPLMGIDRICKFCRVSCGGVINMVLILSITFYFHYKIWGCLCSTGPFQYRWLKRYVYSSCYYHHHIGSIHLSHCYHIFPWLCVWDVCYKLFCYLLHIHSGKTGNLFSLLLCSLWWVQIVRYVLTWRSYSFICTLHHLIIIIVQAYLKTLNS